MSEPRATTNQFLELVSEGMYDEYELIVAFCKYLSEDEVIDFLAINELILVEDKPCIH